MAFRSQFLAQLLSDIAGKEHITRGALSALAKKTIRSRSTPYNTCNTKSGLAYVMTRQQVAGFLRASGIEKWGRATWLSLDQERNTLSADVRIDHGIKQSDAVLGLIANSALLNLQLGRSVAHQTVNGLDYFAFKESGLVELLETAHSVAKSAVTWVESSASPVPNEAPSPKRRHAAP